MSQYSKQVLHAVLTCGWAMSSTASCGLLQRDTWSRRPLRCLHDSSAQVDFVHSMACLSPTSAYTAFIGSKSVCAEEVEDEGEEAGEEAGIFDT